MTYEEAREEILWVEQYGFIPDNSIIGTSRIKSAFQVAIEALEKQIPKKSVKVEKDWGHIMFIDACPRCKITAPYSNFCPVCGQAIDWSDDE